MIVNAIERAAEPATECTVVLLLNLWVANSYSGRNQCLKETTAVLLPIVMSEHRRRGGESTGASCRRGTIKRAVNLSSAQPPDLRKGPLSRKSSVKKLD
jgi:hypothetical protein